MTCPNCQKETSKIVCSGSGLKCYACFQPNKSGFGPFEHVLLPKWKYGVKLTNSDAMRIKTNKKQPDGTFKPAKRWL